MSAWGGQRNAWRWGREAQGHKGMSGGQALITPQFACKDKLLGERNGKRRTWGMGMRWREGDGGVWEATTNRTQFVKGRGALDSPRNGLAASTRPMGTGQGQEGTRAVDKQHSTEDSHAVDAKQALRTGHGARGERAVDKQS